VTFIGTIAAFYRPGRLKLLFFCTGGGSREFSGGLRLNGRMEIPAALDLNLLFV
jgi:hypothetical protein